MTLEDLGDPGIAFTWLVLFGSEGRSEQTLLTDQDNGIVRGRRCRRGGRYPAACCHWPAINQRLDHVVLPRARATSWQPFVPVAPGVE
jgi:signal-transduction protein with cAMP-binding, CBS, and nucleotidyltransferase domain